MVSGVSASRRNSAESNCSLTMRLSSDSSSVAWRLEVAASAIVMLLLGGLPGERLAGGLDGGADALQAGCRHGVNRPARIHFDIEPELAQPGEIDAAAAQLPELGRDQRALQLDDGALQLPGALVVAGVH